MDLSLQGRVYVVTGATRGLGRATVEALLADGARVVLSGRESAGVERALGEIDVPDALVGVVADNADPKTPARLIAAAQERWGRLDGALISVGGPPSGTVSAITDEQWTQAFGSVFLGGVRLAREIGAALGEGGSLAFVLSTSVRQPIANLAVSNGLRPGLAMVAKTLADELGPRGIRVNGLLPGRIGTERVAELDASTGDAAAARAAALSQIPLGRYGDPEEFGRVAAFLLSPASSFVSGVMVPVDGGMARGL
ncbi:SDR family oxidoreductase [Nocardioides sp. WS12]|uniref:SDR family oxidoreductase n=1 Tax=Nocardioides sp. WS12 TaxID=2486272 RepID=UPI0015FD3E0D|nr:SDR family oxidoreductase [Nocardioides sp. WS12]